jgi:hypothetical protein
MREASQVEMAWKNYEESIVDTYHIALIGWPEDIPFNPHTLGYKPLKRILDSLCAPSPTIYWIKLTNSEYEDRRRRIQIEPRNRKPRSDKGKKRKLSSKNRSHINETGDEQGSDDDERRDNAPRSNECVVDSDD